MKLASIFMMAAMYASSLRAEDLSFQGRVGLAAAEGVPETTATCGDLEETIRDFRPPVEQRVDLWASGPLTIVQTDQVLWYLGICTEPGIRVLCVTYSDNGMQPGDVVTVRGAMDVQDPKHILLDPCLASRD
jgi:hypothetical protein